MKDDPLPAPPAYPGAPRWVKILGIITLTLAVVFVAVHLAGGGFRHHSHFGGETPSGSTERGVP
jgi:hypothetical protein